MGEDLGGEALANYGFLIKGGGDLTGGGLPKGLFGWLSGKNVHLPLLWVKEGGKREEGENIPKLRGDFNLKLIERMASFLNPV